jgi:hypothetical protein
LFGYPDRRGAALLPVLLLLTLLLAPAVPAATQADNRRTVDDVVLSYRSKVEQRLLPRLRFAGVEWPPQEVMLLAIKESRQLELWARSGSGWRHIRDYRIKGLSGGPGPKLREGDDQVPEGRYGIQALNANSTYHLSMKIDYPNRFDRRQALADGRSRLGDDIFIHGKDISRGCLAIGDNAIEELFVLTALIGEDRVRVLIAPRDFRLHPPPATSADLPDWVSGLHRQIASDMSQFPLQEK